MPRTTKLEQHPRDMVLELLLTAKQPLAAYAILELLKVKGINSPQIIYRALQDLEVKGVVHKVGSLNAYLACNEGCSHKPLALITICAHCKRTNEMNSPSLATYINKVKENGINLINRSVIELPIICDSCC